MQLSGTREKHDRLSADSLSQVCMPFSQPPTSQQEGNFRLSASEHLIQSACSAIGPAIGALMRIIDSYYRTEARGSQRHEQIGYYLFRSTNQAKPFQRIGSLPPLQD